jgi:hypothetical protein
MDSGDSLALVADVDGVTEEQCIPSRIQVVSRPDGLMTGFSLAVTSGPLQLPEPLKLSKSVIDTAITMGIERASNFSL